LATARAFSECEVNRIEKKTFARILRTEPTLSAFFLEYSLKRTIQLEEDLVDQLFNSSEKRLARALLRLANFGKGGVSEPHIAKVSQATLAEMIGTTRSRVSFFMNKFRKLGFVSYDGTVRVHNSLSGVLLDGRPALVKADVEMAEQQ
jgi:CRP-like cAMP-binding protein